MVIFGTRPEAIKMCPLVKILEQNHQFETVVSVTGQHKEMLEQVLSCFHITPKYNLAIMQANQTLYDITMNILEGMTKIFKEEKPDLVLVHGDTTTTYVSSLAAFYLEIPIGHVEAGLRTYDITSPYPEEFNRQSVGIMAKYHFAPTNVAKENLLREGKNPENIFVTGNTAIDALTTTISKDYTHPVLEWAKDSRMILLTAHRRENLGEPLYHIFNGIKKVLNEVKDIKIVYPLHMNPVVRKTAQEVFGDEDRVKLIEPLEVVDFHNFLNQSYLIMTDSGGIQEEAPSLGKPVLVLRNTTERPEGVEAGTLKLVGTDSETIYKEFKRLLMDKAEYERMSKASNPYGNGTACQQIVDILEHLM